MSAAAPVPVALVPQGTLSALAALAIDDNNEGCLSTLSNRSSDGCRSTCSSRSGASPMPQQSRMRRRELFTSALAAECTEETSPSVRSARDVARPPSRRPAVDDRKPVAGGILLGKSLRGGGLLVPGQSRTRFYEEDSKSPSAIMAVETRSRPPAVSRTCKENLVVESAR